MNCVYALTCPYTGEPKYVGVTTDLKSRVSSHRVTKGKSPVALWTQELRRKRARFGVITLDEGLPCKETNEGELFWMDYLRFLGANLLNVRRGGRNIWADETPLASRGSQLK